MTQFKASIRWFDEAQAYLGSRTRATLGHNTVLERRDDGWIQVKYHGSPVVTYVPPKECDPQPAVILSSCGWKTLTTKERINAFCPAGFRVYQERSVWYLSSHPLQHSWTFADGITILANGTVVNAGPENEGDRIRKLTARINKYAHEFARALVDGKIPAPDSGDCWYCSMFPQGSGSDHLTSHLDENYLVPSLLLRAIESKPLCRLSMGVLGSLWGKNDLPASDIGTWEKDILLRDVPRTIAHYFKHELNIAA